jgi:hypothetical protein
MIDTDLAASHMEELQSIVDEDGGKLWGVPLSGQVMFVDPNSRAMVTNSNEGPEASKLQSQGSLYAGTLAAELPIANTTVHWDGKEWVMVMLPLPTSRLDRRVLMVHESWHRIQGKIPIAASGDANSHLNSLNARITLQMEWLALAMALESAGDLQRQSIRDAILFRTLRRSLSPNSDIGENRMELHEGLAEYTGIRLGAA